MRDHRVGYEIIKAIQRQIQRFQVSAPKLGLQSRPVARVDWRVGRFCREEERDYITERANLGMRKQD